MLNSKIIEDSLDWSIVPSIERFFVKVNERLLYKMGELPFYDNEGDEALGLETEYFHFSICGDDRMRYLGQNIVLEDTLSIRNKLCNAVISHLYGGRRIHTIFTGITNPKLAHIDFERLLVDPYYVQQLYDNADYAKSHSYKFYGTTELHTSLQTAARNFCRVKYGKSDRQARNTDILEWVASWITEEIIDDLVYSTRTLESTFSKICNLPGIGAYYGYHLAVDASLIPESSYHHDEQFCVPGPGCCATLDAMFPKIKEKVKKLNYGDLVCWIEQNQKKLFPTLTFNEVLYNIVNESSSKKMFSFDQNKLMVYGLEVGLCQRGIYERLRMNPHLIERRKSGSDPDLTAIKLREDGNSVTPAELKVLLSSNKSSNLLQF